MAFLKVKALARLFRLMDGLMKLPCPTDTWGRCYWCGNQIREANVYYGDKVDAHTYSCPWQQVIAYKNFDDEWEARYGRGEAGLQEADGDRSGGGVRPPEGTG